MGFVDRMDQKVAEYWIVVQMKKSLWFPFAWIVNAVQNVWGLYRINRDEDVCLYLS